MLEHMDAISPAELLSGVKGPERRLPHTSTGRERSFVRNSRDAISQNPSPDDSGCGSSDVSRWIPLMQALQVGYPGAS
jgi:hypothetical protein